MTDREREFADAARTIDESFVMSIVRRAILSGSPSRSPRLPTVKGSAYPLIAAGCITHALLLQLLPDAVTPVRPMAYGMVLAFAALVAIAGFITARSNATATADNAAGTANTRKS